MNVTILKLRGILMAPIQVELTDQQAVIFQQNLTSEVTRTGAKGVIIDITAMEVIDTYMARILNNTARMVQLLGARCIVCGMRPHVALTLIDMGLDLLQVETALDIEQSFDRIGNQPGKDTQ